MVLRIQRQNSRCSQAYNDHETTSICQIEAYSGRQESYALKTMRWLGNTVTLISKSS